MRTATGTFILAPLFGLLLAHAANAEPPGNGSETAELHQLASLAGQGEHTAQLNLGLQYANGVGVPQDYVQAYKWFTIAASNTAPADTRTRKLAAKHTKAITPKMSRDQIADAYILAREWRAQ